MQAALYCRPLLGNYIVGSVVTAVGQRGTAIGTISQGERPLLTHPHA
jgi:hypothetical protein